MCRCRRVPVVPQVVRWMNIQLNCRYITDASEWLQYAADQGLFTNSWGLGDKFHALLNSTTDTIFGFCITGLVSMVTAGEVKYPKGVSDEKRLLIIGIGKINLV